MNNILKPSRKFAYQLTWTALLSLKFLLPGDALADSCAYLFDPKATKPATSHSATVFTPKDNTEALWAHFGVQLVPKPQVQNLKALLPELIRSTGLNPDPISGFAKDIVTDGKFKLAYPLEFDHTPMRLVVEYRHVSADVKRDLEPQAVAHRIYLERRGESQRVTLVKEPSHENETLVGVLLSSQKLPTDISKSTSHLNVAFYPVLEGEILKKYPKFLSRFNARYGKNDLPVHRQEDLQRIFTEKDLKVYRMKMEAKNTAYWLRDRGKRQAGNLLSFGIVAYFFFKYLGDEKEAESAEE